MRLSGATQHRVISRSQTKVGAPIRGLRESGHPRPSWRLCHSRYGQNCLGLSAFVTAHDGWSEHPCKCCLVHNRPFRQLRLINGAFIHSDMHHRWWLLDLAGAVQSAERSPPFLVRAQLHFERRKGTLTCVVVFCFQVARDLWGATF